MGGLAKGLRIIESFTLEGPALTVTTAAKANGMTPAAARRCLLTLEMLGFVHYDGKYFRPTPRMTRLGGAYTAVAPLPILAQAHLERVRDELEEACSLAVLEGDEVAFVARAESQRTVSAVVRLGTRLPAYASSTGRAILSSFTEEELDERLRGIRPKGSTPNALTSLSAIRERIREAREAGAAFTDEELEIGVRTMAVPVRDGTGATVGALSVAALTVRTSLEEMRERFLPVLRREAESLGAML